MKIIGLFSLIYLLSIGQLLAQDDSKKEDKKENRKETKKADKPIEKEKKPQSIGELAETAGKRIWENVKGLLNVVVEDVIEKKDKFVRKDKKPKEEVESPKEKEKKKSLKKESDN